MHGNSLTRRQVLSAAGLAGIAALPACSAGKSERLTITKIEVFQVVVPMQDDIINSPEFNPDPLSEFPKGAKVIVKLHTDSGLVGIGETSRNVLREGAPRKRPASGRTGCSGSEPAPPRTAGRPVARPASRLRCMTSSVRPSAGRFISCSAGWRRTRSTCRTGAAARIRWMQSVSPSGL